MRIAIKTWKFKHNNRPYEATVKIELKNWEDLLDELVERDLSCGQNSINIGPFTVTVRRR